MGSKTNAKKQHEKQNLRQGGVVSYWAHGPAPWRLYLVINHNYPTRLLTPRGWADLLRLLLKYLYSNPYQNPIQINIKFLLKSLLRTLLKAY